MSGVSRDRALEAADDIPALIEQIGVALRIGRDEGVAVHLRVRPAEAIQVAPRWLALFAQDLHIALGINFQKQLVHVRLLLL